MKKNESEIYLVFNTEYNEGNETIFNHGKH